jgi:Fe-S-cluster-containing hydrogenase component 2
MEMATATKRNIVKIDEEKCNGCGMCAVACVEGAIKIIEGKAKLVSETYCDGLGACLGECPKGAIAVEVRDAEPFDEEAAKLHMEAARPATPKPVHACPSSAVRQFAPAATNEAKPSATSAAGQRSQLSQWPVQLTLVPPTAPFLQGAEVILTADCVPFAYAGFQQEFLLGRALLVACPKLDDFQAHQEKLTEILRRSDIKSLTVVHMEVPCCSGLTHMAQRAVAASGKDVPLRDVTISIRGERKD